MPNLSVVASFHWIALIAATTLVAHCFGPTLAIASPVDYRLVVVFDGVRSGRPASGIIQARDGNFYGMIWPGNPETWGAYGGVFKMDSTGAITPLHNFNGADGSQPTGGTLLQATDGNFYGTAGTVFKMDDSGAVTVLATNGGNAPLIQATDGNFYGTTPGDVFRMDSAGTITLLHSFTGGLDGEGSLAALVQARDGNFYGTTASGGAIGSGTVFKIDSAGVFTLLHSFTGADGAVPYAPLIQASDGNFYGTTAYGGASDLGTVFKIDSAGALTVLHSFNGADGAHPLAGLLQARDGNFYGTTNWGGFYDEPYGGGGYGVVFQMDSTGAVTVLHAFEGYAWDFSLNRQKDGTRPSYGSLIQADDGTIYGTTFGGERNTGTVFALSLGLADGTPPVLTVPASVTADATGPMGAVVTYVVTATDNDTIPPTVTCVPVSGSTFPIGTTSVSCTASDPAGNISNGSFQVIVEAAATQVTNLVGTVQSFNLSQGIANSLDRKLDNVMQALSAAKGGNVGSTCNMLDAFIHETVAQSGKAITSDQASQLLSAADRIKAVIGCP